MQRLNYNNRIRICLYINMLVTIRDRPRRTSQGNSDSDGRGHRRYRLHLSSFISTSCILYCTQIIVLSCDHIDSTYLTLFIVIIYLSYSMCSQRMHGTAGFNNFTRVVHACNSRLQQFYKCGACMQQQALTILQEWCMHATAGLNNFTRVAHACNSRL